MALDTAFYLVTKDIAIRSGLIDRRYRTLDGRFILDNKDLSRVRFTTDEYISGLEGVEKITESEAKTLIAQGGYKKGLMVEYPNEPNISNEETNEEDTEESTTDNEEETVETNEKEEEE